MSWAEVQNLKDKMSALADATLYINVGKDYAGKTLMLKRYDSDYMSVTVGSQGTAEVSVQPKSRYELVTSDAADGRTSDVFYVEAGDYKEVNWDMSMVDGDIVLPLNDALVWLRCGGLVNKYRANDTIDKIVADSACLTLLLNDTNALKYMIRSKGELLNKLVASSSALAAIGASIPASYAVAMDTDWSAAITSLAPLTSRTAWSFKSIKQASKRVTGTAFTYADGTVVTAASLYNAGDCSIAAFFQTEENSVSAEGYRYNSAKQSALDITVQFPTPFVLKKLFITPSGNRTICNAIPIYVDAFDSTTQTWKNIGYVTSTKAVSATVGLSTASSAFNENKLAAAKYKVYTTYSGAVGSNFTNQDDSGNTNHTNAMDGWVWHGAISQ